VPSTPVLNNVIGSASTWPTRLNVRAKTPKIKNNRLIIVLPSNGSEGALTPLINSICAIR